MGRKNGRKISLFWPTYHGKEIQLAMAGLFPRDMSNRWLGQAHLVDEFEKQFAEKFGYKYCLALNSGTAALELSYHLIGLKESNEIIAPVLTCTATNIPLLRNGVKIVFADIRDDLTIDTDDIAQKITPRTKAIIATTLGGLPVDKRIFALARKYKVPVVIDAAQSVGVSEPEGDYICYSFQAIKHFTTGDGGMLIVRNKRDYVRAKKLRWFGIDREAKIRADWQPYQKRQMTMDIEEAGYKFHMNDIAAALGLIGLRHSDEYLAYRKRIAEYYSNHLKCKTIAGGAYWLFGVLVGERDRVAEKLKEAGVETNLCHLRNDIFTVFGGRRLDLPRMNEIEPQYLYIPLNTKMTMEDAKYIVRKLNSIL